MCQSESKYTNLEPGKGPITVQTCEQMSKEKREDGKEKQKKGVSEVSLRGKHEGNG